MAVPMHLLLLLSFAAIVLALDVAALSLCLRSTQRDIATKLIWSFLIIAFPVLGAAVFLVSDLIGTRLGRAHAEGRG